MCPAQEVMVTLAIFIFNCLVWFGYLLSLYHLLSLYLKMLFISRVLSKEVCFTEFALGTLREHMFFIDNEDLVSALREKCSSGLLTELPATMPHFQKSQNWVKRQRQVEFLARETQRKEEKPRNNRTQSDIWTSTSLSSSFLGEKHKHCTAGNECTSSGSELSR